MKNIQKLPDFVNQSRSQGAGLDRHYCDIALGGSTVAKNLWPQPLAEAEKKDLEVEMQRLACGAFQTLTHADAAAVLAQEQREIADDRPAAYRRYTGGSALIGYGGISHFIC